MTTTDAAFDLGLEDLLVFTQNSQSQHSTSTLPNQRRLSSFSDDPDQNETDDDKALMEALHEQSSEFREHQQGSFQRTGALVQARVLKVASRMRSMNPGWPVTSGVRETTSNGARQLSEAESISQFDFSDMDEDDLFSTDFIDIDEPATPSRSYPTPPATPTKSSTSTTPTSASKCSTYQLTPKSASRSSTSQLPKSSSRSSTSQLPKSSSRSSTDPTSRYHESKVQEMLNNCTPKTTLKTDKWAVSRFENFLSNPVCELPYTKLEDIPITRLNYVLEAYVLHESTTGVRFKTLYAVVLGLTRALKRSSDGEVDLLHQEQKRFKRFRNVLDGIMKELQSSELVTTTKADALDADDEDALWISAFGEATPQMLLVTNLFNFTKVFALRGPDELRDIRVDSVELRDAGTQIVATYRERRSKNKQGGLKSMNKERKVVSHYEQKGLNYGFVYYYRELLLRSHADIIRAGSDLPLWQHPVSDTAMTQLPWYHARRPIGRNYFNKLVTQAFITAGLDVKGRSLSLRSIRATVVTTLTKHDIDPTVIAARTGHSTQTAVNAYKRVKTAASQVAVSKMLTHQPSNKKNSYSILIVLALIGLCLIAGGLLAVSVYLPQFV